MNTGCLNTPIKSRGVLFLFLIFRFCIFIERVCSRIQSGAHLKYFADLLYN